jgi:hypothetical protein
MPKIAAGSPASRILEGWPYAFLVRTIWRARTFSVPCRFGSVAVGNDPFNGRKQGVVVFKNGRSVGLQTADRLYFYDYRQITRPD